MSETICTPVVLTVYIFTFLIGLPSNLLACYTFLVKVRQRPTPIDILLLNLTISDISLLIFLPFKMLEAISDRAWPLPPFLCPLTSFFFYSSIYISSLFLMAVSVERYLGVAFPIQYKLRRRPAYATAVSVVFWVVGCAHCSIVYIIQYQDPSHNSTAPYQNTSHCYEEFTPRQLLILLPVRLELFLVLFCLPFTVTIFCYVNFVRILVALPNIPARRKQRASPSWRVYTLLLSTLNAALDPAIFYFSSTAVQRAFGKCLAGLWHKLSAFVARCHLPCLTRYREGGREVEAASGDEAEGSTT
ncbi:free fatty acid receptor 2-like [Chelydra serpentina]|uniref:Free fatty acid receptor 1 n=1 Tax=Chelydra serpentina TaxID=8475 RepID=A0A8T1S101_CHESE|nr:free fatty acid receptor 2-like [Chelydra serpentina]